MIQYFFISFLFTCIVLPLLERKGEKETTREKEKGKKRKKERENKE